MLEELKKQVCQAYMELASMEIVAALPPSVSGIDRSSGHVVISPPVSIAMSPRPESLPVLSLDSGQRVEGDLAPAINAPMHLELYRGFSQIRGVAHVHSPYATAWAQAGRELPPLGATHAVYFLGPVPCTRQITGPEARLDYDANIGKLIVERFGRFAPMATPAVLVHGHGPVTWGISPAAAVDTARILEDLAKLAATTIAIEPYPKPLVREMLDTQFYRRHGSGGGGR